MVVKVVVVVIVVVVVCFALLSQVVWLSALRCLVVKLGYPTF
jgi:hypothetical protein